ncbi:MAG: response regulator transcription factor [Candidatus Saccharimonadales bacterium]
MDPTTSKPNSPANPAADPANYGHRARKRILMVEDDDALANVYTVRLQAENFDVRRVSNGEDALAAATEYRPNLILLDVMMPEVDGFDVLDILRNTPTLANIKIVMLTALSQQSDKDRAEKLGADDYLVKSQVVIDDVIDRIKHHLDMA